MSSSSERNGAEIQFFVPGHARPQGSKRLIKGRFIEMGKDHAQWRATVAEYAKEEANGQRFLGPVRLRLVFWFVRPQGHFRTGKFAGQLKDSAPTWKESAPDLDKLVRAIGDALVIAGVIPDDRYIVVVEAEKRYGDPGVLVNLQTLQSSAIRAGE